MSDTGPTRRDVLRLIAVSAAGCALSRPALAGEDHPMLLRAIPKTGEKIPAVAS